MDNSTILSNLQFIEFNHITVVTYYTLFRERKRGQEKLSDLLKITRLVSVKSGSGPGRLSPELVFLFPTLNDLLFIVLTENYNDSYLKNRFLLKLMLKAHSSISSWPSHC